MRKISASDSTEISFELNGQSIRGRAQSRTLLTDFLRHEIGATGTHTGCEHGVCGACTIRIDGDPARACCTLAVQVEGCSIETVEGLADAKSGLSVLQQAFADHHGLQCGFCTSGILMSLDTLFRREPHATEARVRQVLSGHLCRCTGYTPIVKAALAARDRLLSGDKGA